MAYNAMFYRQSELLGARYLWKTKVPAEFKFFFWLALQDYCWTSQRRQRHGLTSDATYALCSQCIESIDHLVLGCVFSREVWSQLLHSWGWQHIIPHEESLGDWWTSARKRIAKPWRKAFDSIVLLTLRSIWLERNGRVVNRTPPPPPPRRRSPFNCSCGRGVVSCEVSYLVEYLGRVCFCFPRSWYGA
jgi:hypothetical protein